MIEVCELNKQFGAIHAVKDVSFRVEKGDVLGFLGPNGAGKTTTMRMITGYLPPTSGRVSLMGHDVATESLAARSVIGYLPESAPTYGEMTVREFLRFIAEVRGFRGIEREKRVDQVMERCFLTHVQRQTIETLSKGYRQRVGLAQALLHEPRVLIMDEPTDGLDPNQKHIVRNMITDMGREKAIILSTHVLEEVEAICSRVIIIAGGRLVANSTPAELKQQSLYHNAVLLRLTEPRKDAPKQIKALDKVTQVEKVDSHALRIYPEKGEMILPAVLELARNQKWPIASIYAEEGRLDEVFRRLTATQAEEAAA